MPFPLTFVELFAGVGGLSLGLEMAGWKCLGHAEWEDFPRRVLKHRWPDIPLWGDVSKLDGHEMVAEVGPFTMLTFGAPCQDFSVAGKREGLDGERSVLVLDAIRIWEQSGAPLALYENVVGMLSSNKGEDFGAILSTFVGARVAVPARGWRGGAGVVSGPAGVAAWRTLDAQYFGVPQRRRRVFVLCSRDPRVDPAEILSLSESVPGDFKKGSRSRKGIAVSAGAGAGGAGGDGGVTFAVPFAQNQRGELRTSEVAPQLTTGGGKPGEGHFAVLAFDSNFSNGSVMNEISPTVKIGTSVGIGSPPAVIAFEAKGSQAHQMGPVVTQYGPIAGSLTARGDSSPCADRGTNMVVQAFGISSHAKYVGASVARSLRAEGGDLGGGSENLALGNQMNAVLTYDARGNGDEASTTSARADGSPCADRGQNIVATYEWHGQDSRVRETDVAASLEDAAPTLNATNEQPFLVHPALMTTHYGKHAGSNQHVTELAAVLPAIGVPRRLTPVECERLMGWPDGWTDVRDGKGKAAPDTARYKACGNGVAAPVSAWLGFQLKAALTKHTL